MRSLLVHADTLLRAADWSAAARHSERALPRLAAFIVFFGLLYGAIMGTYGGIAGQRILQVLYSGLKVPLLLLATFALSLPSFFVLNTLAGLRDDFAAAVRALVAAQAALTIVLASLAPFTAVWYLSVGDYPSAILFNAVMFGIASVSAQLLLKRFYRPLIASNPRHRLLLRMWLVVYAFVGIQMGWVLRPFIGDPGAPTRFFRAGMWGNAYERLLSIFWSAIGR